MKKPLNAPAGLLESDPDDPGSASGKPGSANHAKSKVLEKEKMEWPDHDPSRSGLKSTKPPVPFVGESPPSSPPAASNLPFVPTQTARALMRADQPWSDLQAKSLIAYLPVIALTLKTIYPDYRKYSLEQISQNIQPGDSSIPLEERKTFMENSEQIFGEYGRLHYDILSWIRDMETQEDILINIELQLTSLTPQKLYNRLLAYLAQMIAFQKNNDRGFLNDRYEDLKPMRTLWIFPRARQNLHIHLNETVQNALDLLEKERGPKGLPETEKDMIRHLLKTIDIRLIFVDPDDLDTIKSDKVLTFVFQLFGQTDRRETIAYVQKEGIALEKEFLERMDRYEYCLMGLDKEERTVMRAEVGDLRDKVDSLHEENCALLQKNDSLHEENHALLQENDSLHEENHVLRQELARLKMLQKENDGNTDKKS